MSKNHLRTTVYKNDSIGFRDTAHSEVLNDKFNQARSTILRTILRGKQTYERVHELTKANLYSQMLMQTEHQALIQHMSALQSDSTGKLLNVNFYEEKPIGIPSDTNVNRDRLYGQVTLAETSAASKIPRYTDAFGDRKARTTVSLSQDGVALDADHPLFWAINGDYDRFWIDDTATPQQNTVILLTLPASLKSEVNNISLIPFPHRGSRIISVEYKTSGGFVPVSDITPSVNPVRYHFAPSQFSDQVRITLEASDLTIGSDQFGIWGIGHLDVGLSDYASTGSFYSKFTAKGSDTLSSITSLSADYSIDSMLPINSVTNPPVTFELQKTDGTAVYSSTGNIFPLTTADPPIAIAGSPTELWLKVTLTEPIDRVTPIVRSATLTYA